MEQRHGFVDSNFPSHVFRLQKTIYGLKQALHAWYKPLSSFLLGIGFIRSRSDPSLFIYNSDGNYIYFLVYADDLLIIGSNMSLIFDMVRALVEQFSIEDLGSLHYFLGIEVAPTLDGLFFSQQKYVHGLLQCTQMDGTKVVNTPLSSSTALTRDDGLALADMVWH